MRRRSLGALVAGSAIATVVIAVVVWPSPDATETPGPGRSAGDACREVQRFLDVVAANGAATQAVQALDRAVAAARQAADADPTWIALSGGAESLRVAVRADDRQAASVGTSVVREQCRQAGAPLSTG